MSSLLRRLLQAGSMIILISLMVDIAYCADDGKELQMKLEKGNVAFSENRFKEAVTVYSELIRDFGFSPELLHNLANSYAADGQDGRAILNYMRGLRIAPADDDLRADLALVREKVGLFNEEHSMSERFFGYYDMNQWLTRALAAYVLVTLLLALNSRFQLKKGIFSSCIVLAGLIVVCCAGASSQWQKWNGAVITQPETRLLLSPFEAAASNGSLIEGTMVYSLKKHQDYYYVLDEKGRSGWVSSASFEPINISSSTYSPEDTGQ
jgi:tetratricopeptide (TPR) repeat protein